MSKRAAVEAESLDGQSFSKTRQSAKDGLSTAKRPSLPPDTNEEMGEFEDEWEDDLESDEGALDGVAEELEDLDLEDNMLPAVEEEDEAPQQDEVYLPGSHPLAQDEVLEPDQSVYEMLHHMNVVWPCLSFDIMRDGLGNDRRKFPATAFVVSGTQADVTTNNELLVMKMSQLHKTQKDADDSDDDSDEDDGSVDEDALLEYRSIPHVGGVNRVRAQPFPSTSISLPPTTSPYYVASWADTGKVHIWDVRPLVESLDVPGYSIDRTRTNKAVYTVGAHKKAEGFAMDWSPHVLSTDPASLRLLSGDIHSKIFLTTGSPTGFNTSSQPFASHTSSVEDIQWSPSEQTVFASCSADRSIRIWDVRVKGRNSVVGVQGAHESDVNVISWNTVTTYLLVSGGDEGGIKIWDLRNFKGSNSTPTPVAAFTWHTAPITSIEWHPTEDSIFAASGADEQITLWDLSVELDDDESPLNAREIYTAEGRRLKDVPPQLLFVHQGQNDVKEIHWHPQIPGAMLSTAADGFNIFKTISV